MFLFFFCSKKNLIFLPFLSLLWVLIIVFSTFSGAIAFSQEVEFLLEFNFFLVLLSIWSVGLIYLRDQLNPFSKNFNKLNLFVLLLICTVKCFLRLNILDFYCFFELSLIPIFFLILGWGYQPERLGAALRLLFYTLTSSLPLLIFFLLHTYIFEKITFFASLITSGNGEVRNSWLCFFISISFLIKLPIFGAHLWLPRAHVEAPVFGSIVLAAILLKLGVCGLFLVSPILRNEPLICWRIQSFSCAGGAVISILCLRISDIKILIAYSSVAHIGILLASLIRFDTLGNAGVLVIAVSHGFVSSAIFWGANIIYNFSQRRRLLLNKSILSFTPFFTSIWFIFCIGNIGAPPTLNSVSEIYFLISILSKNIILLLPCAVIVTVATAYTINAFIITQHRQVFIFLRPTPPISKLSVLTGINHTILVMFRFLIIFWA